MHEFTRSFFRGVLKGYSEEGRRLRRRKTGVLLKDWKDSTARFESVKELDKARRLLGVDARHALIAYGLLRGRPYKRIEQRAHTIPSVQYVFGFIQAFGSPEDMTTWTLERVSDEIEGPRAGTTDAGCADCTCAPTG